MGTLNIAGVAQPTPISRKKLKSLLHVEQNIFFFSLFSLSSRPEAAGIYKLPARLPVCPPACPKPALLCYKKTEQNECDCIIFVTLCSSNCLYTKKKQQISKNRLQLCRNISLGMTATTTYNKYFLCLR